MGMRALVTGLSTYWGGRVAQALEQRSGRRGRRRRRHQRPAHAARTDRVRPHRLVALDPLPHRARDTGRHDRAHASRRRLHAARRAARSHEINVIGTLEPARGRGRAREPGAQAGAEELRARLRREQGRSVQLPRRHGPDRSGEDPGRAFAARGRSVRTRLRRRQPARRRSACCASRTCSASTSTRRSPPRSAGRSCPRSSASTPACSSSTRTTSSTR